jgi:hypothetical protein
MPDHIIITARKFAKHWRRYQRELTAGSSVLLKRRGKVFAIVTGTERVDVDVDLIVQVRHLLDPAGEREMSDREIVSSALQLLFSAKFSQTQDGDPG